MISRTLLAATLIAVASVMTPAQAEQMTLEKLGEIEATQSEYAEVLVEQYFDGASAAIAAVNALVTRRTGRRPLCIPPNLELTTELVRDQFELFREKFDPDPETPVALVAVLALSETFRCR